jgi:two-component system, NarL family, nitrate/nitrite response regulator NarL
VGMRILVFSPVRLFGEGIAACLQSDGAVEATASCYRSDEVVDSVAKFAPGVLLVDVAQHGGLQEGRALAAACPGLPIVALATGETSSDVIACADAGFTSYVRRDAPLSRLRTIIEMALRGEVLCDPKVSGELLRELRSRRPKPPEDQATEPLTRRECDVLRHVARGFSNKEIARQLGLSEATIKNHVHEILAKLHVNRRTQALALVREQPWLARVG